MASKDETLKKIDEKINQTCEIMQVLTEIRCGNAVAEVLEEHNIDSKKFNRWLNSSIYKTDSTSRIDEYNTKDVCQLSLNAYERLWYEAFESDKLSDIPSDIEDTLKNIIKNTLTKREKKYIRMRFWENLTLDEIAKYTGVTRERVRQVINKALRKIRGRSFKQYKYFGDSVYRIQKNDRLYKELINKREQLQAVNDRIEEIEKELNNRTEKLSKVKAELGISNSLSDEEIVNNTPIEELELSVRSYNCLKRHAKINTIGELRKLTYDELMSIRNFGRKSLDEIANIMRNKYDIELIK